MQKYLESHLKSFYLPDAEKRPGLQIYQNRRGWKDCYLGQYLLFSHRVTTYDMSYFPEKLHTHEFFEMDIFYAGQISYIVSDHEVFPQKGDILLVPPGVLHTARQTEKSEYDRVVFYFDRHAFEFLSQNSLPPVFQETRANCLSVNGDSLAQFHFLLEQLEYTLSQEEGNIALLCFSYVIQLFRLIGLHSQPDRERFSKLPPNVLQIKTYLDENFRTVSTAAEAARHFFYSREYLSRLFKQYFNTNISEYLIGKKITAAKEALEAGQTVTQAFSASGYRSMSAFISAFHSATSMQPSAYRKQFRGKQ